eukprot:12089043-Alexandrium_andersonii.AAC.1
MEAAGLSYVRVGEASKPGPDEVESCVQSGSWILESINVTALRAPLGAILASREPSAEPHVDL